MELAQPLRIASCTVFINYTAYKYSNCKFFLIWYSTSWNTENVLMFSLEPAVTPRNLQRDEKGEKKPLKKRYLQMFWNMVL